MIMMLIDRWVRQRSRIAELEARSAQQQKKLHEGAMTIQDMDRALGEARAKAEESRRHLEAVVAGLGATITSYEKLLGEILIAVGRVRVLEGQATSDFAGLPWVVSMVVTDHEDLEGRIDAVVEYLRSFGSDEVPVTAAEVREKVGRLLQGADPEIVDMQGIVREE